MLIIVVIQSVLGIIFAVFVAIFSLGFVPVAQGVLCSASQVSAEMEESRHSAVILHSHVSTAEWLSRKTVPFLF